MTRLIGCVALVWSSVGLSAALAQHRVLSGSVQGPNTSPEQAANSSLEFSRPKIIADLNARPTIAGRFDCSDDGSIYTFIDGYAPNNSGPTPKERLALLAIHPDGSVTSFPWRFANGFSNISRPKSVFVGNGRVYVLVEGSRDPAAEGQNSFYPIALAFNQAGALIRAAVLEQGLDPLVLGAFKSGNLVVISEDRLNHRMALDLFRADGMPIRQLELNDSDYLAQASKMATGREPRSYNSTLLIAMSKFFPFGDHLLLVPLETSGLPIIELGEEGVVKAVVPQLPEGTVLDSLISSTASRLKVRLGAVVETQHPALDSQGNLLSFGTEPSERITELSLADGSVVHEIDLGSAPVQPACESGGVLRLLTSSGNAGKLSVVTAQVH
jgi:hypothetical protein